MAAKNNIFAIDFDAVIRAVSEANAALTGHHIEVMAALGHVPPILETSDDIEHAKRFVKTLKEHSDRCRKARLSDTKPLRDLVKKVEEFFKNMEAETARARKEVLATLSDAGREQVSAMMPATLPNQSENSAPDAATIMVNAETGEIIGSTSPTEPRVIEATSMIPLTWQVEAVDRDSLDLKALLPYLTDAALLNAAKSHLKSCGPHTLRGASYTQVAAL